MNNLERYLDQVIEQKPVAYEASLPPPQSPKSSIAQAVLRRWYIALLVTLVICGVGGPAIWLSVDPRYVVVGAMRVSPAVRDILTGKPDYSEATSYREFVNTQVIMLTSSATLVKIADALFSQNLPFFSGEPQTRLDKIKDTLGIGRGTPDPVTKLKDAIDREVITVGPVPLTTLVAVTMKDKNLEEAKKIVDSFLTNYKGTYGTTSEQEEADQIRVMTKNKDDLFGKIDNCRKEMGRLSAKYATPDLTPQKEMELAVQARLLTELTELRTKAISMEADIAVLEKRKDTVTPEQAITMSNEFVNSDATVKELSAKITGMENDLIVARRNLAPENPAVNRLENLVNDFKKTLEDRRKELETEFSARLDKQLEESSQSKLKNAKAEQEQLGIHQDRIQAAYDAQVEKTKTIAQDDSQIQDIQAQLKMHTDMYDTISRQLRVLEMEKEQRPQRLRVDVAYSAEVAKIEDKRVKFLAALVFAALACGCGLALLRDKSDKTLQTPEDVSRQLGLPLLGTTTSSRTVRPELFAEQIAGDYQTIRTNLGLATSGGMPRRITVSSAGTKEGKTTFAVNLATSLAKSGKKVLLIDGDLRKPDVRYMLNLPNGTAGLQEVLLGEDPSQIVRTVPGSGLHVLVANSRNLTDVYELLTSSTAAEQIERLGREYDHLIVDTPPALAFPDALVWAKMTDAVILVGFAGQTTSTDLQEAKDRFTRIRARVLGAILSNVRAEQSLYRYNYGYVSRPTSAGRKTRKHRRLLLPAQGSQDKTTSQNT
jgi:polysaccharide biosynthesis transport protein